MKGILTILILAFALMAAVAGVDTTEYENVIHPGSADGSGFWNAHAKWFMYAPAEALMELDAASRIPDGALPWVKNSV